MRGQLLRLVVGNGSQLIEAEASFVQRKCFRDRFGDFTETEPEVSAMPREPFRDALGKNRESVEVQRSCMFGETLCG